MTTPPSNSDTASQFVSAHDYGQPAVPQPKIKKRLKLEPADDSRLSMLMSQLPELEVQKREAEEKLAEHKKAIQQEIAAFVVANGLDMPDVFDIPADPYGAHPAYTLSSREGAWRLNTEAMKAEDPETYVKWAVKGNPYWELKKVQKNRVHRG
jgi:hypothetical protein